MNFDENNRLESENTENASPVDNLTECPDNIENTENTDTNEANSEGQKKQSKGKAFISSVFDVLEMFAWSVFAVMLIFTFAVRLCRVEGSSMENTLYHGQNLLLSEVGYTPKQDDIIVFHLTKKDATPPLEKTMVKRVIATEGQKIEIYFETGEIFVDGVKYEDTHAILKNFAGREIGYYTLDAEHHYEADERVFSATVPKGCVFVMGDNRNNSKDSRDSDVGFVDTRCILGKVIVRIAPFTVFSK